MIVVIILIVVLVLVGLYAVVSYNGLVSLRNRIENAWAQIDVQLKRRYDLIPNLVETVKGYAAHERETLDAVIAARNAGMNAQGPHDQAQAENMITGALKSLFALSEAYPDLKANQNFAQLQEELTGTEGRIAYARQFYNDTVYRYNTKIQSFPSNILASMFRFSEREYFQADDESRGPPRSASEPWRSQSSAPRRRCTTRSRPTSAVAGCSSSASPVRRPRGGGLRLPHRRRPVGLRHRPGRGRRPPASLATGESDAVALRMSRARPGRRRGYARYHNIVEGLCIASGLPKPRLYVIDDPAPNAFATGRSPRNAAVAVTTGLLDKMNRIELEGVLAARAVARQELRHPGVDPGRDDGGRRRPAGRHRRAHAWWGMGRCRTATSTTPRRQRRATWPCCRSSGSPCWRCRPSSPWSCSARSAAGARRWPTCPASR